MREPLVGVDDGVHGSMLVLQASFVTGAT